MNLLTKGLATDVVHNLGLYLLQNYALGYLAQTVFLFVALWIMIKVQRLNCNLFALLGSAALACALDYIPYVGIEISVVALLLCITKAIGSRTFTDAIFTTGIAYALTFCFNLFVLSMLLGNLRHLTPVRARTAAPSSYETLASTNSTNSSDSNLVVTSSPAVEPPAAEMTAGAAPDAGVEPLGAKNAGSGQAAVSPNKLATDVVTHFTIRGISRSAVQYMAMIGNGTHTYDVVAGDKFQMQTSSGKANVVCDSVEETQVVLNVEGVKVTLRHKQ